MTIDLKTRPNAWPWAPLLFVVGLIAAIALSVALPFRLPLPTPVRALGVSLVVFGLALYFWAIATMRRAQTNLMPTRAADRLVDWGPFSVSRHPIYVGGAIAFFGLGVAANNGWVSLAALIVAAAEHGLAIVREEAHMAARFGAQWTRYAARTPCWLGPGSFRFRRPGGGT